LKFLTQPNVWEVTEILLSQTFLFAGILFCVVAKKKAATFRLPDELKAF
jgi:hypothetical protein